MHILAPVDGSEPSRHAVELAAKLTNGLNSKLTILAVHQYIVGRKVITEVQSQDDVDQLLKASKSMAMSFGLNDVTAIDLKSRDVAHAIVDYAEKNGVDLIVMGGAGKGNIKSFVIGSVSADVLRKSVCPVTIVH